MQYRRLGESGLKVSEVALGSWLTFGNTVDQAATDRVVRQAIDAGINLLDTADVYARGEGEKALGRAICGVPRHELCIASKCYFPFGDGPNDRGLSRKHVVESLHGSLRRLGTDYLDLYQCHRYDESTPLLETVRAMDDLIRQGKVLYWGVSLWPAQRIAEVTALCDSIDAHRPISNQPAYSMLNREVETDVLPTCAEQGLGMIVYSPLAQGVLTGKYQSLATPPPQSRAADRRANAFIDRYLTETNLAKVRQLAKVASELELSLGELALCWCLRHATVSSVIVGARTEAQIVENARASGRMLPEAALARIEQILAAD